MKQDIQSEKDIQFLVDSFYNQVLVDEEIGYIFTEVAQISVEKHMPIMYNFWNSILLGTHSYYGNPMIKHIMLNEKSVLKPAHFQRWVTLWEKTINEHFEGEKATLAIERAKNIARIMEAKVLNKGFIRTV